MANYSLNRLLRSICHNLRWEYAIFWKLRHQNGMILTSEDWYCNYPELRESGEVIQNNVYVSGNAVATSTDFDFNTLGAISLAVASMSCLVYSLGEGLVGRVASMGKHFWISVDEFNASVLPDYSDEWQLQFAVGIKTILLVPVVPDGVLQLGSVEKVTQDLALVADIKDMFSNLLNVPGASNLMVSLENLYDPSSCQTNILEDLAHTSGVNMLNTTQSKLTMDKDLLILDDIQMTKDKLSTINSDIIPQFMGQDVIQVQGRNESDATDAAIFGYAAKDPTSVSRNRFSNKRHLEFMAATISSSDCFEKCDLPYSQELAFASTASMNMKLGPSDNMSQPTGYLTGNENIEVSSCFLNFPLGSELHKALGSALQKQSYDCLWESSVIGEDPCSRSLIYHLVSTEDVETSIAESEGQFLKSGDVNNLLGAVVANVHDASGNDACRRSISEKSPSTCSGQCALSCQTESESAFNILRESHSHSKSNLNSSSGQYALSCQTESESAFNILRESHSHSKSNLNSSFIHPNREVFTSRASSLKHKMSKFIDEKQQRKELRHVYSRKGAKSSQVCKRKGRLDGGQKPRPRDRQMIQDRVKELRELVPNGAKCSIDALLHQTIKHMLFLRGMTNQAEKLKNCIYPEAVARKKQKPSVSKGYDNGASWAIELGQQCGVCPIVVRDLDQPGYMLIEMLCEEHELFLEIALVIRRLDLGILRGVMVNRKDQMWAHYIVEVSKGFQRMDIFWPLMQLLQRSHPMSKIF